MITATDSGITTVGDVTLRGKIVAGRDVYVQRVALRGARRRGAPPNDLPAAAADFTGRDAELAAIRDLARRRGHASEPAVCVISGPAGVGKSALALRAAHELASRYPDGCLYADLGGTQRRVELEPADILGHFRRQLGYQERSHVGDARECAAQFRAQVAGKRVLIVLDNAARAQDVRTMLPGSAHCLVIVTSRNALGGVQAALPLRLEVLSTQQSLDLLRAQIGGDRVAAEQSAAAKLAQLCGGLPLALRIAGARLRQRPAWSITALVDKLSDADRRFVELRVDDGLDIGAVLSSMYDALDPHGARAFQLLALAKGPDLDLSAACALLDASEESTERVLDVLLDAALLESAGTRRYHFHDLLKAYAEARLHLDTTPGESAKAFNRLVAHYRHKCADAATVVSGDVGEQPGQSREHAAALAWMHTEQANVRAVVDACLDEVGSHATYLVHAVDLATQMCVYLGHSYSWSGWEKTHGELMQALREAKRPELGGDFLRRRSTLLTQHQRFDEAQACLSRARACYRAARDAKGEASAYFDQGFMNQQRGEFEAASVDFSRALRYGRKAGDARIEGKAELSLGVVSRQLGRLDEAWRHYEAAGPKLEVSGDRHSLGQYWMNMGNLSLQQWHVRDALRAYEQAWALLRDYGIGAGRESVRAGVLTGLGLTYLIRGRIIRGLPIAARGLWYRWRVKSRQRAFAAPPNPDVLPRAIRRMSR